MNRIQELMAQAGFDPAAIERMGVMPQANKFAELIVRECLGIYDKIENGNLHLGTDRYPHAVGRHFGLVGRPTVDKTAD